MWYERTTQDAFTDIPSTSPYGVLGPKCLLKEQEISHLPTSIRKPKKNNQTILGSETIHLTGKCNYILLKPKFCYVSTHTSAGKRRSEDSKTKR